MIKITRYLLCGIMLLSFNSYAEIYDAPDINLPGTDGNVQLKNLRGKVVYLDFWASWCEPCKTSFPWMAEMKQAYANQGFEILAVNLDKDKALADEFLNKMKVNFQIAFDEEGVSAQDYKVKGMPSSYLIDREGKVLMSHIGFKNKDRNKLEQAIKIVLANKAGEN